MAQQRSPQARAAADATLPLGSTTAGEVLCAARQPETGAPCKKKEHPPDEAHEWAAVASAPRVAAGASSPAAAPAAPSSSPRAQSQPLAAAPFTPRPQQQQGRGAPPVLPASRMVLPTAKVGGAVGPGFKLIVAGTPGAGKTTLGTDATNPIFIPAEVSPNVPADMQFPQPRAWEEIGDACRLLLRGGHGRKTLVLDTIDAANRLCIEHVKSKKGLQYLSEGSGDYGKGKEALLDEWGKLCALLDRLRNQGMNIILLAHVKPGKQRNPDGADYDAWKFVVDDRVADYLIGWTDIASFATLEVKTQKSGAKGPTKGAGVGARWWYFAPIATALFCKNRHNLPPKLPLQYDAFAAEMLSSSPELVDDLVVEIREKAARLQGRTFRDRTGATVQFADWVEGELKRKPEMARLLRVSSSLAAAIERLEPGADEASDRPTEEPQG